MQQPEPEGKGQTRLQRQASSTKLQADSQLLTKSSWHPEILDSLPDTLLHSRQKRSSSIHQKRDASFPNQETLTSHSSNPSHNKKEQETTSIQKGHLKHSNLNKMKTQRNIQQVKEHDKSPPNQRGGDRESA